MTEKFSIEIKKESKEKTNEKLFEGLSGERLMLDEKLRRIKIKLDSMKSSQSNSVIKGQQMNSMYKIRDMETEATGLQEKIRELDKQMANLMELRKN